MGNMNSIDVAHIIETGRRAIHVEKLQPGNFEAFLFFFFLFFIFATHFCTILNCFCPNRLFRMEGLFISAHE